MRLFSALRDSWPKLNYDTFRADLKAGTSVAFVALPLSLALAVAVDVSPEHGLFTVVTAGLIIAIFGGSRFQVSGPTAAFVVVLLPIVHRFGLHGLLYAGFLAGLMMCLFSFLKIGRFIKVIPFPVITGFSAGIAVVIFCLQLKDFLGVMPAESGSTFLGRFSAILQAAPQFNSFETAIGIVTLLAIVLIRRFFKNTPAPVLGLFIAFGIAQLLERTLPGFHVTTLADRYPQGIPDGLPSLVPFWSEWQSFTQFLDYTVTLLPSAVTIALLGAIESLLSAVVADSMTQTEHDSDAELFAQGLGNIVGPFFGGIAATGAVARTATNIRFGAFSPFASIIHCVLCFGFLVIASPIVSLLPTSALAALLMVVAYNMADFSHIKTVFSVGTRDDRMILLACCGLTVIFDMTVGVMVGIILATVLFARRVSEMTAVDPLSPGEASGTGLAVHLPKELQLFKIKGPLFFGVTQRAVSTLSEVSNDVRAIILDMREVPLIDSTALVGLESALRKLQVRKLPCYICISNKNLRRQIETHLKHVELTLPIHFCSDVQVAIQEASRPAAPPP